MQTVKFYKVSKDGTQLAVAGVKCIESMRAVFTNEWRRMLTVERAERVMHRMGWRRKSELTAAERRLIPAGGLHAERSMRRIQERLAFLGL